MAANLNKPLPAPNDPLFWRHVDKCGPVPTYAPALGPCWLWTACLTDKGYGKLGRKGIMYLAHRWAYAAEAGRWPEELDHLCRVRCCVRPSHLEDVDHRTNTLRGETISALAASRTHCPQGHPYEGDNLIREKDGSRKCKTCKYKYFRAWKLRQRSAQ